MKYLSILTLVASLAACASADLQSHGLVGDGENGEASALAAFERLGAAEAAVVYQALSPDEQSALWREQLQRELVRPETSDEEALFLAHVLENFEAIWSHPEDHQESLHEEFGGLALSEFVTTLGSLEEGSLNAAPTPEHLGQLTGISAGGNACNRHSIGCGCKPHQFGTYTVVCSFNCGDQESGCGLFWAMYCSARYLREIPGCAPEISAF